MNMIITMKQVFKLLGYVSNSNKPVFGSPVISINNVIVGVEDVLFELNIEDAKDSGELAKISIYDSTFALLVN